MTKRKLKSKKKLMYETLIKVLGNVSEATRRVGIDRTTHYDWLKKDENYKAWVDEIEEATIDFGESALHKLMNAGNPSAIIFFLKTKGKRRGYVERQEIAHFGEAGIKIEFGDVIEVPPKGKTSQQNKRGKK